MSNKKKYHPNYISEIIKLFPKVTSGRKNHSLHQKRINETFKLINKFKGNKINE